MELLIVATTVIIVLILGLIRSYCKTRDKNKDAINELTSEIKYLKLHQQQAEAEKYKNWGDNLVTTGPYSMRLKEPAKQCTFSQWEINDDCPSKRHPGFILVYGKGNAEKVLKALNNS
jgi:hypothetical protein